LLFNSLEFIFVFLPLTIAVFLLVGKAAETPTARIAWLAAASLAFYAYWDIDFVPVICVSIVANFLCALALVKYEKHVKIILAGGVILNLAAIGFYKYTNFGIQIWGELGGHAIAPLRLALPLGISFFTFTQIAYLADVAAGRASERNFMKYVLFVTYFPHLIAGPIMHHREMMPQFSAAERRLTSLRLAVGLSVFAIGLFKKAVIADYLATLVNPVFAAASKGAVASSDAWGGALAYSLQIYFDFSGYCDMAMAVSFLFGIVLPFNFDAPYKASSIAEFWHRWHITLSRFLRDYVYIPLGGNRHGEFRRMTNIAATMLIGGFWHGAGWTFVAWGALHGIYLIGNHAWIGWKHRSSRLARIAQTAVFGFMGFAITQFLVVIAWVYFRADSLASAHQMFGAMAGLRGAPANPVPLVSLIQFGVIGAVYLACFVLPNVNEVFTRYGVGLDTYALPRPWSLLRLRWAMDAPWGVATAALFVIGIVAILVVGDGTPFLYFQF
jgi:D-alanyl-lipoteichoic acid acyltransferase DltB (MBOAT superfamily)